MKNNNTQNLHKYILIGSLTLIIMFLIHNNNNIIFKENYSNYTNICKSKPTKFYDLNNEISINSEIDENETCKYKCDNSNDCHAFLNKDNDNNDICKLYNLENNEAIKINCHNNIIPESEGLTYNGNGFVNSEFYYSNKNKFSYQDFLLEKANLINDGYREINNVLTNIEANEDNYESLNSILDTISSNIVPTLKDISGYLDLSYNLFTGIIPQIDELDIEGRNFNFIGSDISSAQLFKKFDNLAKQKSSLDGKQNFHELEFKRRGLIYLILSIILFISIVIIICYKLFPKTIPDYVLFIYFIFLLFLVFFIQFIIKQ